MTPKFLKKDTSSDFAVMPNAVQDTSNRAGTTIGQPARNLREGWAEAATRIVADGGGELILGDFDNDADADLWVWEGKTE